MSRAADAGQQPAAKRQRKECESQTYTAQRILGKGSYGTVYQAQVLETGEIVAIKCMRLQEREREIQVLKELAGHPNIIAIKGSFLSDDGSGNQHEQRLNVVLEYAADTLHRIIKHYNRISQRMEVFYVRLFSYQLLRSLLWCHSKSIVHCDVKPQNLLVDGRDKTLKLCDFGTSKRLVPEDEGLRCYICSRYYRAPELILGSLGFTSAIDLWSAGCVIGEMILGQPMFTGKEGINQLNEIIHVIGTPTAADLQAMNPAYPRYEFQPAIEPLPWTSVFDQDVQRIPSNVHDLVGSLLKYSPSQRICPLSALLHPTFDQLRAKDHPAAKNLFNFRKDELWHASEADKKKLIPSWYRPPAQPSP